MNRKLVKEKIKKFRVVAALIRKNGKVLLAQRWFPKYLNSTWEFPGGKVELGESDEAALKRELLEELGIESQIGSRCFETCYGYGNREVHLLIYRVTILKGEPRAYDVKAIEWIREKDLVNKRFSSADLLFVRELASGYFPEQIKEELDDNDDFDFKPAKIIKVINIINKK